MGVASETKHGARGLTINRRSVVGGILATPIAINAALAAVPPSWFDLEFRLSSDQETLTVEEIAVAELADSPAVRFVAARWEVSARKFGPRAFFDMKQPSSKPIGKEGTEHKRTIVVRQVSFGLRFGPADTSGYVALQFTRPTERWSIAVAANLWLKSNGQPDTTTTPAVPFASFVHDGDGAPLLTRDVKASAMQVALGAVFAHRLEVEGPKTGRFSLMFDRDQAWTLAAIDSKSRLSVHRGSARGSTLTLAWRNTEQVDDAYFSGNGNLREIVDNGLGGGTLAVGPCEGHHLRIRPRTVATGEFEVLVGPAPTRPEEQQAVARLSLGEAALAVADGDTLLADGIGASSLIVTEAVTAPATGNTMPPRVLRIAVSGMTSGAAPGFGRTTKLRQTWGGRGDVATPVGQLTVDGLSVADLGLAQQQPPEGSGDNAAQDRIGEVFKVASGDRSGAPDGTVFALFDLPADGGKPKAGLRRVYVDMALLAADAALPDTSYSRLTFRRSEVRLAFEDGTEIAELPVGEYPRPIASSHVWIGPASDGTTRAVFDLSGATLTCARDYDMVKLRLRFHDLLLAFEATPVIRPRREDARVRIGMDGSVEDERPILVAEFDPQHVLEEAIFWPAEPPLPDVDVEGLKPPQVIEMISAETTLEGRKRVRREINEQKKKAEATAGKPFATLSAAMEGPGGPVVDADHADQLIYVGPFALDPDVMAWAREKMAADNRAAVQQEIEAMLLRIDGLQPALRDAGRLQAVDGTLAELTESDRAAAPANEQVFESIEPLYSVFRSFWRDQAVAYSASFDASGKPTDATKAFGFNFPAGGQPERDYFAQGNRPFGWVFDAGLKSAMVARFVTFSMGQEETDGLMGGRLSGPSRLAFRIDCEPQVGADAWEAGTETSSGAGPDAPGAGNSRFLPIPFTFAGLTDWSRYEAAVTRRARKLYQALPSGLLPRPGNRAPNRDDLDMLRFQGFSQGPVTADQRISEIRASLTSERIATPDNQYQRAYPGEPLDFETAIELPARLFLSTAQDAVWRTNREIPDKVYGEDDLARAADQRLTDVPAELKEGETPAVLPKHDGKKQYTDPEILPPRRLWSARLDISQPGPEVRVVGSPDLRSGAISVPGVALPMPGTGAPPRGPYAPWFIGPEQSESSTLAEDKVAAAMVEKDPEKQKQAGLMRWLGRWARFRKELPSTHLLFRTSLDAFDRHQLVLASSTYGLPVIGRRLQTDPDDVTVSGGLISDSGQIEPGETFSVLEAGADQAVHKPVPLGVKGLSLTALGGSLLHETAFRPSAGADDIFGKKIFAGFVIDTWQSDIVLGRDVRTEVVYKGYLLPLGHRASFVKLTERIFVLTRDYGIKAILRQRMYLHMADRIKLYGALGQPHGGRMWFAKTVELVADHTPDVLDPTSPAYGEASDATPETTSGRIFLGAGNPGLAFWPRTSITDSGLYKFEVKIGGTLTEMPMIFVDNIAATTPASMAEVAKHYNNQTDRRRLEIGGKKLDYAPNTTSGEAQFETNHAVIRVHGRSLSASDTSWTGELEAPPNFQTTGVLEGGGQPPFYPAMEFANIRLGPVERMSGGKPEPVDVQYDGHYVLYGFDGEPLSKGLPAADGKNGHPAANSKQIFLNLRKVLKLDMGGNGDRSGGIARPQSYLVAVSKTKGPLGGDEATWWAATRLEAAPSAKVDHNAGAPKLVDATFASTKLVSLASYFNEEVSRPDVAAPVPAPGEFEDPAAFTPPDEKDPKVEQLIRQVQSIFSFDAKLLGTVRLKDLMRLLDIDVDSVPVLKEVQQFGSKVQAVAAEADGLAQDLRTRVLVPLREVVGLLRRQWTELDKAVRNKQASIPPFGQPLGLKEIYPEVDSSLKRVEDALEPALQSTSAAELFPQLGAIHGAARELIHNLKILAANPVERLEAAVSANLNERISAIASAIDELAPLADALLPLVQLFSGTKPQIAEKLATLLVDELEPVATPTLPDVRLVDLLPLSTLPPDLPALAKTLISSTGTNTTTFEGKVRDAGTALIAALDKAVRDSIKPALTAAILAVLEREGLGAVIRKGVVAFANSAGGKAKPAIEQAKSKVEDAANVWAGKVTGDARTAVEATRDAILDELQRYAADLLAKLANALATPEELAIVAGALARLNEGIETAEAFSQAIKGRSPREILRASGDLVRVVSGIDATQVVDALADQAATIIKTNVKDAAGAIETALWATDAPTDAPTDNPVMTLLQREIAAVAEVRKTPAPALPGPLPLLNAATPKEVIASNALLKKIGVALKKLQELAKPEGAGKDVFTFALEAIDDKRSDIDKAAKAINKPQFSATALETFVVRAQQLVVKTAAVPTGGLVVELRGLYCDIVDLIVVGQGLHARLTTLDGKSLQSGAVGSALTAYVEQLKQIGTKLGDRLKTIIGLITTFADDDHNKPILVAGGVLLGIGGAVKALAAGIDTSEFDQYDQMVKDAETDLIAALVYAINLALRAIGAVTHVSADAVEATWTAIDNAGTAAKAVGAELDPELKELLAALTELQAHLLNNSELAITSPPSNLAGLIDLKLPTKAGKEQTIRALFNGTTGAFNTVADKSRKLEAAVLREWRRFETFINGLPDKLRSDVEVMLTGSDVFGTLTRAYGTVVESRAKLVDQIKQVTFLDRSVRESLFVPPVAALAREGEDPATCTVDQLDTAFTCDRLVQEQHLLEDLQTKLGTATGAEKDALRRRFVTFATSWRAGSAAPLQVIEQAENLAKQLLRGDVFSIIDIGAFRDQIEDAIAGLIPTSISFTYDFKSIVKHQPDDQAIFQPKLGSEFGIALRASLDLRTQKSDFAATAFVGPFDIFLIGSVVDALRLKFGGAAFTVGSNSSARFDVVYEDFEIGKDLEFAKKLQSFLSPKNGGVFVQPMTRGAGIEAGYSLFLGTIGIGFTSFSNVSLNVSAELPFTEGESLFKVSLGRKSAPITMGVLPFMGSAYFSIYAAADGVRGFEAAFEYGGGAAIGFGPLSAECRIAVGVFVRVLRVNKKKTTEIYGTFFAGGSASIWIFHFATSLYVRLGTAADGAMYGEAIYSFSFSIGIADYDYSVTAYKKENAVGSQKSAMLSGQRIRVADNTSANTTGTTPPVTRVKAADQLNEWERYAGYFDTDLIKDL